VHICVSVIVWLSRYVYDKCVFICVRPGVNVVNVCYMTRWKCVSACLRVRVSVKMEEGGLNVTSERRKLEKERRRKKESLRKEERGKRKQKRTTEKPQNLHKC